VSSGRSSKFLQPTRSGPRSRGNSAGNVGRLYSWYYQHFEPADNILYPESDHDLHGSKGRLLRDNAEMACKWCEDHGDRFTVKYKPKTNLRHHLLKSCTGFQTRSLERSRCGPGTFGTCFQGALFEIMIIFLHA
jgi:hypothetical protein